VTILMYGQNLDCLHCDYLSVDIFVSDAINSAHHFWLLFSICGVF
jgi:hypothetical protein